MERVTTEALVMFSHVHQIRTRRNFSLVGAGIAFCLVAGLASQDVRAQLGGTDACAGAEAISGSGPFLFDNTLASIDGLATTACDFFGQTQLDHDVWFCWTAPIDPCPGGFIVDTCGQTSVDTKIAVYDGCGTCPPVTPVSCSDDDCGSQFRQTRVLFDATPGQSYAVRVGTFPGVGGGTGNFTVTCATPPATDACSSAESINSEGAFPFDTIGATLDGPLHADCAGGRNPRTDHDVWFCWTAPCTGMVFAETCDLTVVDTKVSVYNGCGCPATEAALITCNDDDNACGVDSLQSRVGFQAIEGRNYLLRVGTFAGAKGGVGDLDIRCGAPTCPNTGGCFAANPTGPGCDDQSCCETVCAVDRFCCMSEWDDICARRATGLCTGSYNTCTVSAGTCDATGGNGTPGCSDTTCCNNVCAVDPFCCISEWDSTCVAEAAGICTGGFAECSAGTGSCQGSPGNGTPGCDDQACCDFICADDPLCCVSDWDEVCALREASSCESACMQGIGDCFAGPAGAGCQDDTCCAEICDIDPFCCFLEWDSLCAARADLLCPTDCPVGTVTFVDPPDNTVYAGYPFDPMTLTPLGPNAFDVQAPLGASPGCFRLCESDQIGDPNAITSVTPGVAAGALMNYTVTLGRPITPGAGTTVIYINNDGFADIAIGVSRADLVDPQFPQGGGSFPDTGRQPDQGDVYIIYGNNINR